MIDKNFEEQVLAVLQKYANALENEDGYPRGASIITSSQEMDATISIPGVRYDSNPLTNENAVAEAYVQIPWAVMANVLDSLEEAVEEASGAVEGAELVNATLSDTTLTVTDREGESTSVDTAAAAKAAKQEWDSTYKPDITSATTAAQAATTAAELVNAQLSGMTVSVTNRNGVTTSVNIGFEVYRTYASVAAMNADAANVPDGKFVMIATTDPTDPENARLYAKNASGSFTFLSDLDQASSAAWADWLNNQKPLIEQATADANAAATLANTKAGVAQTAADNADASRTAIEANEATRQNNETTRQNNETARVAAETTRQTDWTNWFSDTLSTGVRKIWNDWYAATTSAWNTWFGTDNTSGVQKEFKDLKDTANADHTTAQSDHSTASTDHTTAQADHTIASTDHTTADSDHTTAETDHLTASTDHTTATSDHTIALSDHSVAESDHIQAGTDHTRAEADHSRAESDHTTADSDHTTAGTDHSTASTDHSTAVSDHTLAGTDHSTASTDHNTAEADHSVADSDHTRAEGDHTTASTDHSTSTAQVAIMEEWNTHQPFIGDGTGGYDENYWYIYDTTNDTYVRSVYAKGDNLDWDSMTEEEKERLLNEMMIWMEQHGFDSEPIENSAHAVTSGGLYNKFLTKQDVISDLGNIRSGAAAGATAYQKPSTGIPSTDMSQAVQEQLTKDDLADFNEDSTHRLVTDTEKTTWNSKQDALIFATTETCESLVEELT